MPRTARIATGGLFSRRESWRGENESKSLYKSFPVETDDTFFRAVRDVERNVLRADLVPAALPATAALEDQQTLRFLELDLGNPHGHDLVYQIALGVEKFHVGRRHIQRGHRAAGPLAR